MTNMAWSYIVRIGDVRFQEKISFESGVELYQDTWMEGVEKVVLEGDELFNIENEGPEANGMKFCCFCGKKLVEVVAEAEEEGE